MSTQDHKGRWCGCFDADECDRRTAEMERLRAESAYAERLRYLLTIYQHAWKHDARIPSNIEAQAVAVLADLAPSSSASQGEKT